MSVELQGSKGQCVLTAFCMNHYESYEVYEAVNDSLNTF